MHCAMCNDPINSRMAMQDNDGNLFHVASYCLPTGRVLLGVPMQEQTAW